MCAMSIPKTQNRRVPSRAARLPSASKNFATSVVLFRRTAFIDAFYKGPAQNRQDPHVRAIKMLQKNDLELDRVFDAWQ